MNNGSDQATDGCNFPENSFDARPTKSFKHHKNNEWGSPGSLRQPGNPGEMIYRLLCCTSGSVTASGGFSFCKTASECEWARSHHLYYFPDGVFNISELSFSGGAQCLHSGYWESYLTQLRHFYSLSTFHTIKTHSRKWKSFATVCANFYCAYPTSNCFWT